MISKVAAMPNIPEPFLMRNWTKVARDYDNIIFDFNAKGDFLPLVWLDNSHVNCDKDVVGMPSYINSKASRKNGKQEGINIMSAVLGASLCGIDKSNDRGHDFVDMLEAFYNSKNGQNLFLNTTQNTTGDSFWYETYPNVLMSAISNQYQYDWLNEKLRVVAERYVEAVNIMGGKNVDFGHTSYSFTEKKVIDNGRWIEPEAAAGYAFVLYNAYIKFRNEAYLIATKQCIEYIDKLEKNPYYELLLPYGCYIAARLNSEHGCNYDVARMVNWCFDGDSSVRFGWGVTSERWGDYDCHGLCGSLTDWGQRWDKLTDNSASDIDPIKSGYAFAGNTFSMAAGIIGLVNYDNRFAHDVAKWYLNAANSSRLFYQNGLPSDMQSCAFFADDTDNCIAYEGLRKFWDSQSPYATGDPIRYSWGSIDIGLYGSSHVGIFGSAFGTTNDEKILKINVSAMDLIPSDKAQKYIIYNPYSQEKTVDLDRLEGNALYNTESRDIITSIVDKKAQITLPADTAIIITCKE